MLYLLLKSIILVLAVLFHLFLFLFLSLTIVPFHESHLLLLSAKLLHGLMPSDLIKDVFLSFLDELLLKLNLMLLLPHPFFMRDSILRLLPYPASLHGALALGA